MRHVQRRPDIEAVRTNLPITGMEQEIMESLIQNDVVVLCGETGCGKTTQVSLQLSRTMLATRTDSQNGCVQSPNLFSNTSQAWKLMMYGIMIRVAVALLLAAVLP